MIPSNKALVVIPQPTEAVRRFTWPRWNRPRVKKPCALTMEGLR